MMTPVQAVALVILIVMAALLVWGGYIMGRSDGLETGLREGENIQLAVSAKAIRELQASLQFINADHKSLARQYKQLKERQSFGSKEHQVLLDIAEHLRIAAETFSAFRTGKKLERDTHALREQALVMAGLLQSETQGEAA